MLHEFKPVEDSLGHSTDFLPLSVLLRSIARSKRRIAKEARAMVPVHRCITTLLVTSLRIPWPKASIPRLINNSCILHRRPCSTFPSRAHEVEPSAVHLILLLIGDRMDTMDLPLITTTLDSMRLAPRSYHSCRPWVSQAVIIHSTTRFEVPRHRKQQQRPRQPTRRLNSREPS